MLSDCHRFSRHMHCFAFYSDLTLKASVAFHLELECETSSMQIYRVVPAFIADIKLSPTAMCDILRDVKAHVWYFSARGHFK